MIIATEKLPATDDIGVRVIATADGGYREVELWDYNTDVETNHRRAAERVAKEGELQHIGTGEDFHLYRWYPAN